MHKIHYAAAVLSSTHDNNGEISTQLQHVHLPNKYSTTAYLFEASYKSSKSMHCYSLDITDTQLVTLHRTVMST